MEGEINNTRRPPLTRRDFGRFGAAVLAFSRTGGAAQPGLPQRGVEKPEDPYFAHFNPKPVPVIPRLQLQTGDRLAICGDSITDALQYARIIETYLTVCTPELNIAVRNCGKGGETSGQFLLRMRNECLRFNPTVATLCYGMNDHGYVRYSPASEQKFHDFYASVVREFQAAKTRVVLGSPGCIGKIPPWDFVRQSGVTSDEDLNVHLCALRDATVDAASQCNVPFADVFWTMFTARYQSLKRWGSNYALCGAKDGVHPNWAGHVVMAYTFLRSFKLDGDVGVITMDASSWQTTASSGHEVVSSHKGAATIRSLRYAFCADGPTDIDDSMRSGMELVPFNQELNRLTLVLKAPTAREYKLTWGGQSRRYAAAQLVAGVNLAADFATNPFLSSFRRVDQAVLAKQRNEKNLVWNVFEAAKDYAPTDELIERSEAERAGLVDAIKAAFLPVTHTIEVRAV